MSQDESLEKDYSPAGLQKCPSLVVSQFVRLSPGINWNEARMEGVT